MEESKIFRHIKEIISCFAIVSFSVFCLLGIGYFMIKIDTSTLAEMRYCPSCGIDLIEKR